MSREQVISATEDSLNLFKLNESLLTTASKHFNSFTVPSKTRKADILLALIAKAIRSHSAAVILCKSGYGMEADSIVRSMFEDLVNLSYILNETKRETRARRYIEHIQVQQFFMLEYIKNKRKFTKEFPQDIYQTRLKAKNQFYKRYKRPDKYKWSGYSFKELCKKTGCNWEYDVFYNLASQHPHSQPIVLNQLVTAKVDDVLTFSAGPQTKDQEINLIGAFDMLRRIMEVAARFFRKHELLAELNVLKIELNKCVASINIENAPTKQ
jgi:hypothetical protein